MRSLWLLSCILASGQAVAQTACPTRDTLEQGGLRLTQGDPAIAADYTVWPDGTLVADRTTYAPDGSVQQFERLFYVHPLLPPAREAATFHTFVSSSTDTAGLARLPDQTTWDTTLTVLTKPAQGSEPEFEAFSELGISASHVEDTIVTLGECQYDAWIVLTAISFEDGRRNTVRYRFVPDLGLPISAALLARNAVDGAVRQEFFSFEAIEALGG